MSDATPKSVYGPGDWLGEPARDLGAPGRFPFTRGPYPTMYTERLWTMLLAVAGVMLIDRVGSDLTPALGIPRWVAYSSIPVGAGLGALALAGRRFYGGDGDRAPRAKAGHAHHAHD